MKSRNASAAAAIAAKTNWAFVAPFRCKMGAGGAVPRALEMKRSCMARDSWKKWILLTLCGFEPRRDAIVRGLGSCNYMVIMVRFCRSFSSMRAYRIISCLGVLGLLACAKAASDDTDVLDSGNRGKDGGGISLDSGGDAMQGMDGSMQFDSGNCKTVPPSNVCGLDPQCGCGAMGTCDVDFQKLDGTTSCVQSMGSGQIKSVCK